MRDFALPPANTPTQRRDRPSLQRRRELLTGLLGLGALVALALGGLLLRGAAGHRTEEHRRRCLALLSEALAQDLGEQAQGVLRESALCYTQLLRREPFSRDPAFRAQAALDLAAFRAGGEGIFKTVGSGEGFQRAFAELAAARFARAAVGFGRLAASGGEEAALARRYAALAGELAAVAAAGPAE